MDPLTFTALATATAGITGWTATTAELVRLDRRLHTDAMTGLGNRAALYRRHRRTRRSTHTVGLLLADLDRFKAINDTHGHGFGNRVLAAVGTRLADTTGPGELAVRLHGDEFAVWLGPTATEDAETRADDIATALAAPLLVDGHRITAAGSVGLATAPGRTPLGDLLAAADRAMYAAKHTARITVLPTGQAIRARDQHPTHAA